MRRNAASRFFLLYHFTAVAALGQESRAASLENAVDLYGSRLLIGILIAGIAISLYSLTRYRGRIEGALSWGLLLSGVVALPITSLMLGMLLVFERAERVEFCGSCHVAMQGYVRDMKNTHSESLAAVQSSSTEDDVVHPLRNLRAQAVRPGRLDRQMGV